MKDDVQPRRSLPQSAEAMGEVELADVMVDRAQATIKHLSDSGM